MEHTCLNKTLHLISKHPKGLCGKEDKVKLKGVASGYAGAYGPGQIGGPPSRGGTFN